MICRMLKSPKTVLDLMIVFPKIDIQTSLCNEGNSAEDTDST
jgi:hypothetical protein